ncbi:MAG: hypothetical protein IJL57_01330 [Bacteroidales bacterium]|nr:hypothetical protein [Bacteroidales bacterium]
MTTGCNRSDLAVEYVIPDTVRLQTGDLVFRRGESRESRTVTTFDRKSDYTHVGMVVNVDGRWMVLHAVPNERATKQEKDSVKLEPIGVFFRSDRALMGGIYRYPLTPDDTMRLLHDGLQLYGRHPLFDGQFDLEDTVSLYCTELVWFLYHKTLRIDLSEDRRHHLPLFPELIFCSDIFENKQLTEIFTFER